MFSFGGGVACWGGRVVEQGFTSGAFEVVGTVEEVGELLRGCSVEGGGSENVFHGDGFWGGLEYGDFRGSNVSTGNGGAFDGDGGFVWTRVSGCQ